MYAAVGDGNKPECIVADECGRERRSDRRDDARPRRKALGGEREEAGKDVERWEIAGMAVLSETMQAMGLVGEVGRTGRWIRFPSRRGVVYVVASAWGAGYQTFCEPCTAADQEIYLDPVSAIHAGLRIGGGLRVGGSAASDGC